MFERYTELARRAIFFARHEASVFGSQYIESEHILLALLREYGSLSSRVPAAAVRKEVEEKTPPGAKTPTSVDIPLSRHSKAALDHAAKEADSLRDDFIDAPHLVLGLLCVKESFASELLQKHGIHYEEFREGIKEWPRPADRGPLAAGETEFPTGVAARRLELVVLKLRTLILHASMHLEHFSRLEADEPVTNEGWSRQKALGHLVDWATTHHQWFACSLADGKLVAAGYPQEEWLNSQDYDSYDWRALIRLWESINRLLVHVIMRIPEEKVNVPCRIGIRAPMPLLELVKAYVSHCEDLLGQILMRG